MNIRSWLAGGACAAALTLVAASAATASTTAAHHPAARAAVSGMVKGEKVGKGLHLVKNAPLPRATLPRLKNASNSTLSSSNWSGYTDIGLKNVHIRFVSAHLNVPSLNCANSPAGGSGFAEATDWVGLDGLGSVPDGTSQTVEQVGVTGVCNGTTSPPTYEIFWDVYPAAGQFFTGVSPGDALNLSVYYNAGQSQYDLSLTDLNNPSVFLSIPTSCPSGSKCLNSSAEVITQDPGSTTVSPTINLADYGAENFTTANVTSIGGTKGTLSTSKLWTSYPIDMEGASDDIMAEPSALQGGQAFSTTGFNAS
jgi:hypothetical protein